MDIKADKLNEKQQNISKRLGLRKTIKLTKLCNKIFKVSCLDCRAKILAKPDDIDKRYFCKACKDVVVPILDKIDKLRY